MAGQYIDGPRRKLRPRWVRGSIGSGDRPSGQRGSGMEFADFRIYEPGDDSRRLDWRAYAQRGDLVVREYETTRQLDVAVALDLSGSMRYGRKAEYAKRLAELVAFCALDGGDAVSLGAHDAVAAWRGPAVSSVAGLPRLRSWLDENLRSDVPAGGRSMQVGQLARRRSLVFWFSDFMFDGVDDIVGEWRERGAECVCMHVLSQDELEPHLLGGGRHRLEELEGAEHLSLDLTRPILERYRQEVGLWKASLDRLAAQNDGWYFSLNVDEDIEDVFNAWTSAGLLS